MKNAFGENWDGIRRNKNLNEAKDPTKQQIAAVRKSSKSSAHKQNMVAKIMNMREEEEDFVEDGEVESTKPVLSSQGKQKNLNRMNAFVKKVEAKSKTKKEEAETEGSVISESSMKDFFNGLIMSLEAINRKVGSPSKHGNMEIMRDIQTVIRELKKYQR